MTTYRAAWVLPIAQPAIRGGFVEIRRDVISAVGAGRASHAVDLGDVALLPALVNAHTHLELTYLRGAIASTDSFLSWIRSLMAARRKHADPHEHAIVDAARAGIREAWATGTGLIADVSNTLITIPLLEESKLPAARVFYELLGFNAADPDGRVRAARSEIDRVRPFSGRVHVSLAAHAPYSVSPRLLAAIRKDLDARPADISTVHVAESRDEMEFMTRGEGGWRDFLKELGVWTDAWRPPATSPVKYLADVAFLDSRVLAVHGVQCSAEDLARLKTLGATLVACPRSNRYVGVGDPPLEAFYSAGVSLTFGTDSLASVEDLNLFAELAAARRIGPRIPADRLLQSATLQGARALGFDRQFGSIEPGKRAALIAVDVPADVDDVEEYLVSGIEPDAISWLDA